MTGRTLRTGPCSRGIVVALFALAAAVIQPSGFVRDSGFVATAHAESSSLPEVGARLVAVVDVELDEAVVRAGSHVSVVARKAKQGRVLFDVALADGHVVRSVPLQQLRTSFRIV